MPTVVNIEGIGRVNFPDGLTAEQIQTAIEQDILPGTRAPMAAPIHAAPIEGPSRMARVGRGAKDITQGLTQRMLQGLSVLPKEKPSILELRAYAGPEEQGLTDEELRKRFEAADPAAGYTARVNDELALYDKGRQAQGGGFDTARVLGNVAATAPAALVAPASATVLGRAGQGALAGGLSGGVNFNPSGLLWDAARGMAVGGVTGAVLGPVAGYLGDKAASGAQKLIGHFRGKEATAKDILRDVPDIARTPPSAQPGLIQEAQEQLIQTGKLNSEQLSRKANLIAQGVTPTRSMVTRSPKDWSRERNLQKLAANSDEQLSGIGQDLTGIYQSNDRALASRLRQLTPTAGTQEAHGMTVMRSLDDLAKASQQEVSALYKGVRALQGDQLASDARQLVTTLDSLKDNAYSEKLITSVNNRLKRYGMLDETGNLTNSTLTVTQAEELRKFVNMLPNDFGKRDIIKAIDADVLSGAGSDAFAAAREAAGARFAMLDNPATQRALGAWGELAQGKTAQQFIQSQVIDASTQDVKALLKTLDQIPNATRRARAHSALRSGVMEYLEGKAVNPTSGQFSGAGLSKAFRQIGEGKLHAILGPKRLTELRQVMRAGVDATYQPPYAAVNYSNTAPALASWLGRTGAVPGFGPLMVPRLLERGAARMGYQRQFADAMGARSELLLPALPPYLQKGFGLLSPLAPPTAVAVLNGTGQHPN